MAQRNELLDLAMVDDLTQDFNLTTFKDLRHTSQHEVLVQIDSDSGGSCSALF